MGRLAPAPLLLLAALVGCGPEDEPAWDWAAVLPDGVPTPVVPPDNPMSEAKVALGRRLFFDPALSGLGEVSCAACHRQDAGFADTIPRSPGETEQLTTRNSPGLQNVGFYATYTWANPALTTLEDQIHLPLFGEDPREMGAFIDPPGVLARLEEDPLYPSLYRYAWPRSRQPLTWDHTIDALAAFLRSMVSYDSPYDRFTLHGDRSALSESARRGMDLFFSETWECHHCHGGQHLSRSFRAEGFPFVEQAYDNTGLYNVDGEGGYPLRDPGLFAFTGDPADHGRFRPPSLRNVAVSPPYGHDGSIETLREVVQLYVDGGRVITEGPHAGDGRENPNKSVFVGEIEASEQDIDDMMAFLESLTDTGFLTDSRFSDPAAPLP